jgi:hypothetical protein
MFSFSTSSFVSSPTASSFSSSDVTRFESVSAHSLYGVIAALLGFSVCICAAGALLVAKRRVDNQRWQDVITQARNSQTRSRLHLLMLHAVAAAGNHNNNVVVLPAQAAPQFTSASAVDLAVDAEVNSLQLHIWRSPTGTGSDGASYCIICFDEYESGRTVLVQLHCGHQFHQHCIRAWTVVRNKCPLCMQPLQTSSTTVDAGRDEVSIELPTLLTNRASS